MRNKKKQPDSKQSKIDDSWLLPYADMLTLLLALFIILFAISKVDVEKYKELTNIFRSEFTSREMIQISEASSDEEDTSESDLETFYYLTPLKEIQEQIDEYILENNLSETLGTKLTDEGLLITIFTDFSFDTGSATVKEEGRKIAREMAKVLQTDPPHEIIISGHADDRPVHNAEFKSNWELSVMRAVNFMGLLLENDQLDPEKFSAKGFGEYKPIAPNTSRENMAKNRRVEVLILPNYSEPQKE